MLTEDTIVAVATPPGRGGIGVVRISGPDASSIACALTGRSGFEPRHATLLSIHGADGRPIDHVVLTFFPGPHSYTGEDVVEISAHGSPVLLEGIVAASLARGARLANPGEFTLRGYLHGRMDLVQAEAVGELVDAVTPLQARIAFDQLDGTLTSRLRAMDTTLLDLIAPLEASLDFPEEGYHFVTPADAIARLGAIASSLDTLLADASRGRMIREGVTAAIVGRPNAGKSSLFNQLAGADRAIVTAVPGTTRDLLTERVDIGGLPFTVVDTAGVRSEAGDAIEEEGISRARQAGRAADLIVIVLDRSRALEDDDRALLEETGGRRRLLVASKADLAPAWNARDLGALPISSLTGEGMADLRKSLLEAAGHGLNREPSAVANLRHASLLEKARASILRARDGAHAGLPEELIIADLLDARARFDEIVGTRPQDEVLSVIFERFCIGK